MKYTKTHICTNDCTSLVCLCLRAAEAQRYIWVMELASALGCLNDECGRVHR